MKLKKILAATLLAIGLFSIAFSAAADNAKQLESKNFNRFAKTWVKKLNRSHIKGITRMEVLRNPDGSYLARYHHIDPTSVSCTVKKTSSKRKGYVGLLKYTESVYECTAPSPEKARKGDFKVSKAMRVTEIFSNSGKGWR